MVIKGCMSFEIHVCNLTVMDLRIPAHHEVVDSRYQKNSPTGNRTPSSTDRHMTGLDVSFTPSEITKNLYLIESGRLSPASELLLWLIMDIESFP